ncbi:hypothetical protein PACTADRAFT_75080 [Pachysolen tannophilus NRRL Y-2460]|uniref:Large ribosomal subunit protein mL40 n=1 Tax=Pachysolen tannophilus NRRL Y-2460 TaxID=669874 RepID=A0A1E4TVV7_PACTA|nr:hypothetical protein PACTADRAFT_75080 [Pachysolen tannophilus NRRL Y-2460]
MFSMLQRSQVASLVSRGKRTKSKDVVNPATQRIITQLSVLSAARKQPRLLKLCKEDYIKHLVISKAWSLLNKQKQTSQREMLQKQYDSIYKANEDLKKVNKFLFEEANKREQSKRFSLEMRVPTEYPPNKVWYYDYDPNASKNKK